MKTSTLDLLRCPYCGGRLDLVDSLPHRLEGDETRDALLGCHCCLFPVVDGIPVMHLLPEATTASEALREGRFRDALEAMVAPDDQAAARRFLALAEAPTVSYTQLVESLGEGFEGEYFLYRFSDPTYVVARAVAEHVAGTVLAGGGRAIDVCGGSGHLTRALLALSPEPPVVADLYYSKLWLASRIVAPGSEAVCCDANAALPFARGAFRLALCADAFMFVWTKRQLVGEMLRLVDADDANRPGAVLIAHAHNALVWSPSHGQALPPRGYRELFETMEPHVYAEGALLDDIVAGGFPDLSRRHGEEELEADAALTILASRTEDVFQRRSTTGVSDDTRGGEPPDTFVEGKLQLNPLYRVQAVEEGVRLTLAFPSPEYEDEFGACRRYLDEEVLLARETLSALEEGRASPEVLELVRRRVVLKLPERYR